MISLLYDAKKHCTRYPSQFIDEKAAQRSTIQLVTRMLNKLSSACEYSGISMQFISAI